MHVCEIIFGGDNLFLALFPSSCELLLDCCEFLFLGCKLAFDLDVFLRSNGAGDELIHQGSVAKAFLKGFDHLAIALFCALHPSAKLLPTLIVPIVKSLHHPAIEVQVPFDALDFVLREFERTTSLDDSSVIFVDGHSDGPLEGFQSFGSDDRLKVGTQVVAPHLVAPEQVLEGDARQVMTKKRLLQKVCLLGIRGVATSKNDDELRIGEEGEEEVQKNNIVALDAAVFESATVSGEDHQGWEVAAHVGNRLGDLGGDFTSALDAGCGEAIAQSRGIDDEGFAESKGLGFFGEVASVTSFARREGWTSRKPAGNHTFAAAGGTNNQNSAKNRETLKFAQLLLDLAVVVSLVDEQDFCTLGDDTDDVVGRSLGGSAHVQLKERERKKIYNKK